jgi:hypothetical protein
MKVQIESTPICQPFNQEPLVMLNGIVKAVLKATSLDEVKTILKLHVDTYGFEYGSGSSHVWVKQKNNPERILLITE